MEANWNMETVSLPRDLPLLAGLPEDVVARLCAGSEVRSIPKSHELFSEGDDAACLFALLSGVVELYTERARNDATVLFMWPKDVFIPAATITGEPYLLSGRTLTPVKIIQFDPNRLKSELAHNPQFASSMLRIVSGQFRRTVRHLKELKVRSGPQRVAAFMLRLVDAMGDGQYADLPVPKAAIASRLGLTPESFSRAIRDLSDQGLQIRGSRLIVKDRQKLQNYCGLDPLIDGQTAG